MSREAPPRAPSPERRARTGQESSATASAAGDGRERLAEAMFDLRLVSRRRVRRAAARGLASEREAEVVLIESGAISMDEVVSAARRRWLAGHPSDAGRGPLQGGAAALEAAPLCGLPPRRGVATRRFRLARVARTFAWAAATAATVVVCEIALTLAWKEPISALFAGRAQATLSGELEGIEASWAERADAAPGPSPAQRQATDAALLARRLNEGEAVGRIAIPKLAVSFAVVEGTDSGELRRGPGHFPDTALPGQGRTVAIAGHRTTYLAPFRNIDQLSRGDRIELSMPYGDFTYRVETRRIVSPSEYWVTGNIRHERLVLTTCNPLYSASERMVVFARRTAA